jgi:hypothetical protein
MVVAGPIRVIDALIALVSISRITARANLGGGILFLCKIR